MKELQSLPEVLQAVRAEFQEQLQQHEDQSQALKSEISCIEIEIRRLETEQKNSEQKLYQLRQEMSCLDDEQSEALLQEIINHTQIHQENLATVIDHTLDIREELQQQRHTLLAADPILENDLEDFLRFDSEHQKALDAAPAYYRQILTDAHKKMRQRVLPLLEIETKLAKLPLDQQIPLSILLAVDEIQGQLFLTLPILARQDVGNRRTNAVENTVMRTLASLSAQQSWILSDIERYQWAGFRVLTTLFDYSGSESIDHSIREFLKIYILESWPFQGLIPDIQVTQLDWDLWQLRQELTGTLVVIPKIEEEPSDELIAHPDMIGLFTEPDLVSWERPLRVSEDSSWTKQGRRLRTLLIRMISQGRIGRDGLPEDDFVIGLPETHASALRRALPELVKTGIMVAKESEQSTKKLSVNPELLAETQDLINREVSPIWETLVTD